MQLEEDEHVRMLKAEQDAEITAMQKKFADVMGKSEVAHRQQVSYLEECIRKEIMRYEEVSAELIAVRKEALKRIRSGREQVQQLESERAQEANEHTVAVAELEAAHTAFLQKVESRVSARGLCERGDRRRDGALSGVR